MLDLRFTPFPQLHTRRFRLRQLNPDDTPEMFIQRSHPVILRYINREPQQKTEEALQFIEKVLKLEANNESITWAIVPERETKLIGTICLWNINKEKHIAEVGYALHPDHFNKGVMSEVIAEILDFAFNSLSLERVDAFTNKENSASIRMLEKNGFSRNQAYEQVYEDREEMSYNRIYSLNRAR